MRVCVVLSGSVRLPGMSYCSVDRWRQSHHVDVYAHTWSNIASLNDGPHWNKVVTEEPTDRTISSYSPSAVLIEDWVKFEPYIRGLTGVYSKIVGHPIENINPTAMFYSMQKAYSLVPDASQYDAVVRMRFDNSVRDDVFAHIHRGWVIPTECDFGGLNDRFGWMGVSDSAFETRRWAASYFGVLDRIEELLRGGCEFSPERLLAKNFEDRGTPVTRVPFNVQILGF